MKKHNIEVIIVFMPMYRPGQAHFANLKEIVDTIKTWVAPNYFIDYTSSTYCDDENIFYNNNHLSAKGATLVSEDIANQLLSRGIIH